MEEAVPRDEGSSFRASGNSTRVTIEGNTAGQRGGGIYLLSGADVLIERSRTCDQKNTATSQVEEVCTNKTRLKLQGQWKQHA